MPLIDHYFNQLIEYSWAHAMVAIFWHEDWLQND